MYKTYLNPKLDLETRVCFLTLLFEVKIELDKLNVTLKGKLGVYTVSLYDDDFPQYIPY